MNSVLKSAFKKASVKLGIPYTTVELIYSCYWKFIKSTLSALDIEHFTEEDFKRAATNFNIPYIGKLHTSYDKVEKDKRKKEYKDHVRVKKDQACIQSGSGD